MNLPRVLARVVGVPPPTTMKKYSHKFWNTALNLARVVGVPPPTIMKTGIIAARWSLVGGPTTIQKSIWGTKWIFLFHARPFAQGVPWTRFGFLFFIGIIAARWSHVGGPTTIQKSIWGTKWIFLFHARPFAQGVPWTRFGFFYSGIIAARWSLVGGPTTIQKSIWGTKWIFFWPPDPCSRSTLDAVRMAKKKASLREAFLNCCGERGIRTLGTVTRTTV